MKIQYTNWKAIVICSLIAMIVPAASINPAIKAAAPEKECISIFASERSARITEGCTSPFGFCAGGSFIGNHGFSGRSFFTATIFKEITEDTLLRQVVPGESTYTTDDGAITISDVSVFDPDRLTFSGIGQIVRGTGRFAGATGDIFTAGRQLEDGSFINELRGEICIPR